ncbi:hypothetical protein ABI59_11600 [Acidobacteria bacterium Mor1]|nr:hypothetical protein ABI59_11600 [Acidobacteria bacterium Mor1]
MVVSPSFPLDSAGILDGMNSLHPPSSERYRFAGFELRVDQGELRRGSETVELQPQPFKVLTLLVRRAGELVTRDQLRDEIWGRETHVDFDRGLNFCIKQVRRALGDDAAEPRFIRTLPRRGYRFVAEVESADSLKAAPAAGSMRRASTVAAAAVGVVLLTLGVTWWFGSAASRDAPVDPAATDMFLRGQHALQQGTSEGLEQGRELLRRATEIAPELAQAHLALARSYMGEASEDTVSEARSALDRALDADPYLAEAWAMRGVMRLDLDWDWAGAEEALSRAVELSPESAGFRHAFARYLSLAGRHEEAIFQIDKAMSLEPVSTALKADGGWYYYLARRFDAAEALCRTTVGLDPANQNAWWCLLQVYQQQGRDRDLLEAAHALARAIDPASRERFETGSDFWRWYASRRDLGVPAASPTHTGLARLGMGDLEGALDLFEEAVAGRSSCALPLGVDPQVDPLRGRPEFAALLARIGAPSSAGSLTD